MFVINRSFISKWVKHLYTAQIQFKALLYVQILKLPTYKSVLVRFVRDFDLKNVHLHILHTRQHGK